MAVSDVSEPLHRGAASTIRLRIFSTPVLRQAQRVLEMNRLMYISKHHELPGTRAAHDLIETHPLGAWVVPGDDGLVANHLPFLLDRSRGRLGTLRGHVSRANPVWQRLPAARASIVMFQGPQAYITPAWYSGKREHGKVVPTWNYEVAHVHGVARAGTVEGLRAEGDDNALAMASLVRNAIGRSESS
jgi:hypothetical protein